MDDILYVIVPCYNEEEVLPETSKVLGEKLDSLKKSSVVSQSSRILFVDDGSKDNTWSLICQLHKDNPQRYSGLKLTRNKGHQNALIAGLMAVKEKADMTISIDADLQDDVNAMDEMAAKFHDGCHIVYGVRTDRESDTVFKRTTAQGFYKVMKLLGVETVYNHADYRLMSRDALEALSKFPEVNLFIRGMVPLIGYKTGVAEYSRGKRMAGESKYPLKRMIDFAWNGITSFSIRPIRFISLLGFIVFLVGLGIFIASLINYFANFFAIPWPLISTWLLSGLNILSLGLVGEYVGKIYMETKARPLYFVEDILDD